MSIPVARLNHAVLWVRDASAAADFYGRVFGFEVVGSEMGGRAVFMRAAGGDNHHDLGLFSVGPAAPSPPRGSVGLYHLAWEVPTIDDLAAAARILSENGALSGRATTASRSRSTGTIPTATSSRSCGGCPREAWGEYEHQGAILPLDLDRELERWGGPAPPRPEVSPPRRPRDDQGQDPDVEQGAPDD